MTLIEVLVAALVLVVGLLAVFGSLNVAQRGTTASERSSVLAQVGEQALQAVEALPYASIADNAAPTKTSSTDKTDPTYYLSSTCTLTACSYQWDPNNSATAEPVAMDPTGVPPESTVNTVAAAGTPGCPTSPTAATCRITYNVYRFVTNVADPVCDQPGVACPTAVSYKRVTIAVKNTGTGPPNDPVYLSTYIDDKPGGTANPLTQSGTNCIDVNGVTPVACEH